MGKDLVKVPKEVRNKVMTTSPCFYGSGTFCQRRTLQIISGRMDWPGIAKDVRAMFEICCSVSNIYIRPVTRTFERRVLLGGGGRGVGGCNLILINYS